MIVPWYFFLVKVVAVVSGFTLLEMMTRARTHLAIIITTVMVTYDYITVITHTQNTNTICRKLQKKASSMSWNAIFIFYVIFSELLIQLLLQASFCPLENLRLTVLNYGLCCTTWQFSHAEQFSAIFKSVLIIIPWLLTGNKLKV